MSSSQQWPPVGVKPYYSDDSVCIIHGDCREILPGLEPVDLVLTDPPYGIENDSGWGGFHGRCRIENDENVQVRDEALKLARFARALIFGSWKMPRPKDTRQVLIWEKGGHCGMGDLSIPWKPNFEEIYVLGSGFSGSRSSGVLYFIADRECNGRVKQRWHATEKPLPLMRELLRKSPGNVLDPFMGSGTTLRAAKDLGRKAIGIEIEERYCEIAAKRMSQEVLKLEAR